MICYCFFLEAGPEWNCKHYNNFCWRSNLHYLSVCSWH